MTFLAQDVEKRFTPVSFIQEGWGLYRTDQDLRLLMQQ
jgi:hypothetical protein